MSRVFGVPVRAFFIASGVVILGLIGALVGLLVMPGGSEAVETTEVAEAAHEERRDLLSRVVAELAKRLKEPEEEAEVVAEVKTEEGEVERVTSVRRVAGTTSYEVVTTYVAGAREEVSYEESYDDSSLTTPAKNTPAPVRTTNGAGASSTAPTAPAVVNVPNSITILGRTLPVQEVGSTLTDAGDHVNALGKLMWAHNGAGPFGILKNVGVGNTFEVTRGNVTRRYRVAEVRVYAKEELEAQGTYGGYRSNVMALIRQTGLGHDVALLTCTGQSLGGGDATHRLIVFGDEI